MTGKKKRQRMRRKNKTRNEPWEQMGRKTQASDDWKEKSSKPKTMEAAGRMGRKMKETRTLGKRIKQTKEKERKRATKNIQKKHEKPKKNRKEGRKQKEKTKNKMKEQNGTETQRKVTGRMSMLESLRKHNNATNKTTT